MRPPRTPPPVSSAPTNGRPPNAPALVVARPPRGATRLAGPSALPKGGLERALIDGAPGVTGPAGQPPREGRATARRCAPVAATTSTSGCRDVSARVATRSPPPSRSPSPPRTTTTTPRGAGLPSLEDLRPAGEASVVSAVALILGNTIGAGILALPAVGAPAGFGPSAAVLAGVCAALTAEALLIAEVNLAVLEGRKKEGTSTSACSDDIVTLRDMAAATLGPRGGAFVSTAYLSLSYALLVAYIAKAGELVAAGVGMVGSGEAATDAAITAASAPLTPASGAIAFVTLTGAVLFAGTGAVDSVNRAMTAGLLVLYAGIVAAGAASADWGALASADWPSAPAAIPVVLLALVYHDLVPVVVAQLRGDRAAVRTALLIGSAAPLAMFCCWDAVALALAGGGGHGAETLATLRDPLDTVMSLGGPTMRAAVAGFSVLAIATSCLGTSLGLSQTVIAELRGAAREWLSGGGQVDGADAASPLTRLVAALGAARLDGEGGEGEEEEEAAAATPSPVVNGDLPGLRALAFTLVLGPPLAAALANPGSFFSVLNAVGGYGMTALYGMLPPLMAWKMRGKNGEKTTPLLPGGTPILASLCLGAVAIEVSRLVDDLGGEGGPVSATAVGSALADLASAEAGGMWGALARAVGLG